MKSRAAVAFEAGKPLEIVEVDLQSPKDGEVLVEIKATGICHTDAFTLSGDDPEGAFPAILGHEGAGIVREVGKGVTDLEVGDHASSPSTSLNAGPANIVCILKPISAKACGRRKDKALCRMVHHVFLIKVRKYYIIWAVPLFLTLPFYPRLALRKFAKTPPLTKPVILAAA